MANVLHDVIEWEGFMTYIAISEMFWLPFWGALMSLIFIYSQLFIPMEIIRKKKEHTIVHYSLFCLSELNAKCCLRKLTKDAKGFCTLYYPH